MSDLSALFDRLDELPRDPRNLLVTGPDGETRSFPITSLAKIETRSAARPRLERCRNLLSLLEALAEKDGEAL
jgi:hypothetical protein